MTQKEEEKMGTHSLKILIRMMQRIKNSYDGLHIIIIQEEDEYILD